MTLAISERGVELHCCDHLALAEVARAAGGVDAVIVDAPYSERTHSGHDTTVSDGPRNGYDHAYRRGIAYAAWTAEDVSAFVQAWTPITRGWFASLTDHVLALAWESALDAAGWCAFSPLACVVPGSRVRMQGDGPAQWSTFLVVARPRGEPWSKWGALPGAYVVPPGANDTHRSDPTSIAKSITGGKPEWLMRALVRDYTRPGDLVCDPCCGAGTLGVACIAEGRRALLGDRDEKHVAIAAERLRSLPAEPRRGTLALPWGST